jgi:hypothetical protein
LVGHGGGGLRHHGSARGRADGGGGFGRGGSARSGVLRHDG